MAPKIKAPSEEQLLQMLKSESENSIGFWAESISGDQDNALRRYLGLPYGDEVKGRSSVVSNDCAQVVDWALPDVLEPFADGVDIVTFMPGALAEVERAEQASDYVNHIYFDRNDGFMNMYTVMKDGFIQKIGVSKVIWEHSNQTTVEPLFNVTQAQIALLGEDDEVTELEIIDRGESRPLEGPPPPDGPDTTFNIEVTRATRDRARVVAIPPEEFSISRRAASLDDARYKAHTAEKSKADLIEMGFDRSIVMDLPSENVESKQETSRGLRDTRFTDEQGLKADRNNDPTGRIVILKEEYLTTDIDGDGMPEEVQVFRVKNTILSQEVVDEHPFIAFCPEMIPHKFFGQSLVDKSLSTQRTKTVLTRQLLDNVYLANNPQREVPEDAVGEHTISDLLTFRVGGLVRSRRGGQIREIPIPDRSGTALGAIQYFDTVREKDTGITRNSSGIPIDVDRQKTAEETRQIERNENSRKRLMARVFAQGYLVPLFEKLLRFMVRYQDYSDVILVRGKWTEMDPRTWNVGMRGTSQIGLGYMEKQDLLNAGMNILSLQKQALEIGMAGPEQFWAAADVIVKTSGLKFTERFFIPPEQIQPQEPEEDPAIKVAEIKMQAKLVEVEMDHKIDMLQLQQKQAINEQDNQLDFQAELAKIKAETELAMTKLRAETALATRKQDLEVQLALRDQTAKSLNGGGGVRFGGTVG